MKRKSGNNSVLVGGLLTVVVMGGLTLAVAQDWRTGRNHLVEYVQAQMGDVNLQYAEAVKARAAGRRDEAIAWFSKAADHGKVEAMLALGDMYSEAKTLEDGAKAVPWYEKAAKAGNVEAMRKLGICYQEGCSTKGADYDKAIAQFRAAAAKGDAQSNLRLGDLLLGSGHEEEGIRFLETAADAGLTDADVEIGDYFYGEHYMGMPNPHKDLARAFTHYARAANGGNWRGQDAYAYAYFYGRGTKKDGAEAYKWALIANRSGSKDARASLDYLAANLSPAEISEGKRRLLEVKVNAAAYRPLVM